MLSDELAHTIKLMVQQEMREIRPFVYAHIASYDPTTHSVKVVVPSMRDELTNAPVVSGWLPLGTSQSGLGVGIQVAPVGGATAQNPTAGEQCLVALNERQHGVASVVCQFFTNRQQPPSPALTTPILPGEVVVQGSGVVARWHASGDFEVTTSGNVILTATGNVNITATGTVGILSASQVNLGAAGGKKIVRDGDTVTGGVVHASTSTVYSA